MSGASFLSADVDFEYPRVWHLYSGVRLISAVGSGKRIILYLFILMCMEEE